MGPERFRRMRRRPTVEYFCRVQTPQGQPWFWTITARVSISRRTTAAAIQRHAKQARADFKAHWLDEFQLCRRRKSFFCDGCRFVEQPLSLLAPAEQTQPGHAGDEERESVRDWCRMAPMALRTPSDQRPWSTRGQRLRQRPKTLSRRAPFN